MYLVNQILDKDVSSLSQQDREVVIQNLIKRLQVEQDKKDRSGIYGLTQYEMAYNSNRIEGSRLSEDHTRSLFQTGTIISGDDEVVFRAKDVEEATGHFKMFNHMIKTYSESLTQDLIKRYHFHLKSGVFEDFANGYPIGEYKDRKNIVGNVKTIDPEYVEMEMGALLDSYNRKENVTLDDLAEFHLSYERIHPFQDGNGRTGRLILFKECLKNDLIPVIIHDADKEKYFYALSENRADLLADYLKEEQKGYFQSMKEFLHVLERNKEPGRENLPRL